MVLLTLSCVLLVATATPMRRPVRLRRAKQNGVIGMGLNVLLEILGPFECFAAEVALVRLQRYVNTNVRSDVVTFHSSRAAVAPLTSQVQVVGTLAANMTLTDMVLQNS